MDNSERDNLIDDLRQRAFSYTIEPSEFLKLLNEYSKGHIRNGRRWKPGVQRLFRMVNWKAGLSSRPTKVERLSYSPEAPLNRANRKGQHVFYASAGLPTVVIEGRAKEGDFFIVSEWDYTESIILLDGALRDSTKKYMADPIERLYYEIFTSTDLGMLVYSSEIANHFIGGNDTDIHGLLYSSVIAKGDQHNVAIRKDFVDKHLRFVNAILYKLKKVAVDYNEVEMIDFATGNADGTLDWKGRLGQWKLEPPPGQTQGQVQVKKHPWGWMEVRDMQGNLIDPQ
ncbi:hypothetical protein KA050_02525 [Candidatus Gracilibacteria bacterium]|nr:hypothetical protein [Candidatus Gracilibacteria bacterium]